MRGCLSRVAVSRFRGFGFHTKSSYLEVPLSEPLPDFPTVHGVFRPSPETRIVTLGNGVKVAAQDNNDVTSCVGVGINVGSRFESKKEQGMSAILKRLLLTGPVTEKLETIGASLVRSEGKCKDSIYVAGEVLRPHVKSFLTLLRDSLHSSFSEEDLEFQKQSMIFEHEDKMDDPDQFVPEKLFETGITGPLGHPSVPSPDVVKQITLSGLLQFRDRHLRGGNVVVGGVGVELEELLPVSESLFGNLKSGADKHDFMMRYHGGDCLLTEDPAWRARQLPGSDEGTRIHMAFRGPSLLSPDFYAAAVLMSLMGGGSSFSSGGPGKGMYSRLYTQVLNRWPFVQESKCFLFPFEDISLFGFACKTEPYASVSMVEVMVSELLAMTTDLTDEEFARAKNKFKSDMFMDLESRIVQIDDVIRQVLLNGVRVSGAEHGEKIDALTKHDLMRVALQILESVPTVVCHGPKKSIEAVPSSKRIHMHISNQLSKLKVFPKSMENSLALTCKHLRTKTDVSRLLEAEKNLDRIIVLNFSSNDLVEDPLDKELIAVFKSLKTVRLGFNKLQSFPESMICVAHNLTVLCLGNNQISMIPVGFCKRATNLVELDVSKNELSELPSDLGDMKKLVKLNASFNRLLSLPLSSVLLSSLEHLILESNQIRQFPHSIDRLKKLTILRLRQNHPRKNERWDVNISGPSECSALLKEIVAPYALSRAVYEVLAIHRFGGSEDANSFHQIPKDVIRFVLVPWICKIWRNEKKN